MSKKQVTECWATMDRGFDPEDEFTYLWNGACIRPENTSKEIGVVDWQGSDFPSRYLLHELIDPGQCKRVRITVEVVEDE